MNYKHAYLLRWVGLVENAITAVTGSQRDTLETYFLLMTFHLHKPGNVMVGQK